MHSLSVCLSLLIFIALLILTSFFSPLSLFFFSLSSQLSFLNSLFCSPLSSLFCHLSLSHSMTMTMITRSVRSLYSQLSWHGLGPFPVWRNVHIMQKEFVNVFLVQASYHLEKWACTCTRDEDMCGVCACARGVVCLGCSVSCLLYCCLCVVVCWIVTRSRL